MVRYSKSLPLTTKAFNFFEGIVLIFIALFSSLFFFRGKPNEFKFATSSGLSFNTIMKKKDDNNDDRDEKPKKPLGRINTSCTTGG